MANPKDLSSVPETLMTKGEKPSLNVFSHSGLHKCAVASFARSSLHTYKKVITKKKINASNIFMVETRKNRLPNIA